MRLNHTPLSAYSSDVHGTLDTQEKATNRPLAATSPTSGDRMSHSPGIYLSDMNNAALRPQHDDLRPQHDDLPEAGYRRSDSPTGKEPQ